MVEVVERSEGTPQARRQVPALTKVAHVAAPPSVTRPQGDVLRVRRPRPPPLTPNAGVGRGAPTEAGLRVARPPRRDDGLGRVPSRLTVGEKRLKRPTVLGRQEEGVAQVPVILVDAKDAVWPASGLVSPLSLTLEAMAASGRPATVLVGAAHTKETVAPVLASGVGLQAERRVP